MADTQRPRSPAAAPDRQLKCRRLDEMLHRISMINKIINNNNNEGPCDLGKAYPGEGAPELPVFLDYELFSLRMHSASPPPSAPDRDLPLDLSLKAEVQSREWNSSPSPSEASSEASGRRSTPSQPLPVAPAPRSPPAPSPINAVVEQVACDGPAFTCYTCGQMFSLHDRLAKHIASRHRAPRSHDGAARAYECCVCRRRFARSDMLTRHARLHTGVKPYSCASCGHVFTRSDHLSTHQRTHTGEKPYKCPLCAYAACRRDMITRHMRTHTRGRPESPASASAGASVG